MSREGKVFGQWLSARLNERRCSVNRFAQLAHVSVNTVYGWQGGRYLPDTITGLERIAWALNIPIAEVFIARLALTEADIDRAMSRIRLYKSDPLAGVSPPGGQEEGVEE